MAEEAAAEEAAGARKRKRGVSGEGEDVVAAALVADEKGKDLLLAEVEKDDEEGCYEGIAEEAVVEVMRRLEAEISDDLALVLPAQPPGTKADEDLGFVTINGNEESCGPSFSCAASTVMASVDTRPGLPPPPPVPWPFPEVPEAKRLEESATDAEKELEESATDAEKEKEMAADEEEAWLAALLACGPLLEGFSL